MIFQVTGCAPSPPISVESPLAAVRRIEDAIARGRTRPLKARLDLRQRSAELFPGPFSSSTETEREAFDAFLVELMLTALGPELRARPLDTGEVTVQLRLDLTVSVTIRHGQRARSWDLRLGPSGWVALRSHRAIDGKAVNPATWARALERRVRSALGRAPRLGDLARLGPAFMRERGVTVSPVRALP